MSKMCEFLIGIDISFTRNNVDVIGRVVKAYPNTVIVEISQDDAEKIESPSTLTVVNHKNYRILTSPIVN
ncbi:hypothetical protein COD11_13700 [Bacillus sp. AFS040349]|uniref:DUF2187 family protein n=2 Tax=Bacillales TaxID=1385 RepID=UPI000BFE6FB2|nr:DUF2187 family protein [Metabacillus litoralis]PGT82951.1 hypothetical protein COD11_13700 [Bacillus sp. AFS040349]